jgi:ABC-type multidrug transport system fused ATPase/permease subunit
LSSGERQRIAIARALLRNAPILLLDEATANLDTENEREIMDTIFTAMSRCTIIFITHRLVGLEAADNIIILDHGRIVEQGTHKSLMQAEGYYYQLREIQQKMFDDRH